MKSFLKRNIFSLARSLTGRNVMFLPLISSDDNALLHLQYPYRVEADQLSVHIAEERQGSLSVELCPLLNTPGNPLAKLNDLPYHGPATLHIDFRQGELRFAEHQVKFNVPPGCRKFMLRFRLVSDGQVKVRTTTHYLSWKGREIEESYYQVSAYVDYEQGTSAEADETLAWVKKYLPSGRILEIGCATGLLLERLLAEGYDAYGLDISSWAIEKARTRVASERTACVDVDVEDVPFNGPFDAIMLHAVLEHFREPWAVLKKLNSLTAKGTLLFCLTSNADSLSKMLFGRDWEGYFDYSHHGVDVVTSRRLSEELVAAGWELLEFKTSGFWLGNEDETAVSLRYLYAYDSRFRMLLEEKQMGDFITLVARAVQVDSSRSLSDPSVKEASVI